MNPNAYLPDGRLLLAMWLTTISVSCGRSDPPGFDLVAELDTAALVAAVSRGEGIEPATHSGEFQVRIEAELPTRIGDVPSPLYLGVSAKTDTRLDVNAFIDLRGVQANLPELLSGPVETTCKREILAKIDGAVAQGDRVFLSGSVKATFFGCTSEDAPIEDRGRRRLSMMVNVAAVASAELDGQCIRLRLLEIYLDPSGILGSLATLLGVTNRVRNALITNAEEFFADNPVCPELPRDFAVLAPRYSSGGITEIGRSGIGAALSGSIDTSAETLIHLLSSMEARGLVEGQR